MPRETNLELKVGVFVLLALGVLTVFVFSVSDKTAFQQGQTFKVIFNFANGLKKSAPVRMAGVEQGIVQELKVFQDESEKRMKVEVTIKVDPSTTIPRDSEVMINQLGLLGEKYVEIIPGQELKEFLKDGETIVGKDPIAHEALAEKVVAVSQKLEKTIDGINESILSEKNRESLEEMLVHLNDLSGAMTTIVEHIESGEGTLGRLLHDDSLYENLEGFTADIKANPWKLLYKPKE